MYNIHMIKNSVRLHYTVRPIAVKMHQTLSGRIGLGFGFKRSHSGEYNRVMTSIGFHWLQLVPATFDWL